MGTKHGFLTHVSRHMGKEWRFRVHVPGMRRSQGIPRRFRADNENYFLNDDLFNLFLAVGEGRNGKA
jgi:hypothetical protein